MLKSRSSGDSRSNSVESEEQQRQINQSLPSGTDEFADASETEMDKNCLSVRNEQTIPSSPPPSYEHVLEEVSAPYLGWKFNWSFSIRIIYHMGRLKNNIVDILDCVNRELFTRSEFSFKDYTHSNTLEFYLGYIAKYKTCGPKRGRYPWQFSDGKYNARD